MNPAQAVNPWNLLRVFNFSPLGLRQDDGRGSSGRTGWAVRMVFGHSPVSHTKELEDTSYRQYIYMIFLIILFGCILPGVLNHKYHKLIGKVPDLFAKQLLNT